MRLTHLHQVAAGCDDLDEMVRYYRDTLGARFIEQYDPPGIAFFDFGGTRVMFEKGAPAGTLYFRVDDIDRAVTQLSTAGVVFDGQPHMIHQDDAGTFDNPGTQEWMVFFKDPSENTLALVERRIP